ncbi:MAG: FecR domain-containing protein, partial [Balneolaceae bacterium]
AQAPRTFTRPSYRKVMWAVAASILIALLSSLFLFRQSDELEIIAQSHSEIETILLEDKSEVTLRPHSTLYQQSNNSGSRLYKLEGEGYFVVSDNPDRIFSVQAGEGVVEVLGTRFNLREWGSQTEVFLEEGSIRLSLSDRSEEVVLSPGQKSAILPNRQIAIPTEADTDEITGWRNQKLVFQNRKAEELFNELEYHFNIQITAPREVMEERLGGAISLEELDHCLNDLETVLNGEFIASGSNQYRFVSQE